MNRKSEDDQMTSCLAYVLLIVFALPFVGLYLWLAGKDENQKKIGAVIVAFFAICWFISLFN